MAGRSRFLVGLIFLAAIGLASPARVAAQRSAPHGGSAGVAVARTSPAHVYRPYYGPRGYYGYGYPRYYYPYYSSFAFGFGFGFGWPGAYWGAYGYPYYAYPYYPYAYPYPYPATPPGDPYGSLSMRVVPADAVILVDGEAWDRPQGESRFSIALTDGPHRVEVRKEGFGGYGQTVDILGGRALTLNVSLTPGQ
jgi:hypothetical protein